MKYFVLISLIFFTTVLFGQYPENEYRLLANLEYTTHDYKKAVNSYTKSIEKEASAQDYLNRGQCYIKLNLPKSAINDFMLAEKRKKGIASLELAKFYAKQNNLKKARIYIDRMLNSPFKIPESEINEIFYDYAIFDKPEELTKHYSTIEQKLNEIDSDIKNNNSEYALELIDEITTQFPRNAEAYYNRSLILSNKQPKVALNDVSYSIKIKKDSKYFIHRAKLYNRLKKHKKALTDITYALKKNPYQVELYLIRAEAYAGINEFNKAEADIHFAMKYLQNNENVLYATTNLFFKNSDYNQALPIINKLIEQNNSNVEYYLLRGKILLKAQKNEMAIHDFGMALDLDPFNGEVWCNYGLASYKINKTENAFNHFKKAKKYNCAEASKYLMMYYPGR